MLITDFKLLDTVHSFEISIGWEETIYTQTKSIQEASDAWGNFDNQPLALEFSQISSNKVHIDYVSTGNNNHDLTLGYCPELMKLVDLTLYNNSSDDYIEFFFENISDAVAFVNANFQVGYNHFVQEDLVVNMEVMLNE